MKKNEKIMIAVLMVVLAVMCVVLAFSKTEKKEKKADTNVSVHNSLASENVQNNENSSENITVRAIMVNDKVYYDSGKNNNGMLRCGVMDGKITSNIEKGKIPTVNDQANFEGDYGYQYGTGNTIEVRIDNDWVVFETKERRGLELKVYDKAPADTPMLRTIVQEDSREEYYCSVYGYGVFVNVVINENEMSLKSALDSDKIYIADILDKAKEECGEPLVYKDGGSKAYKCKDYTIIKLNRIEENKTNTDVYIGMPDLDINDIK